MTIKVSGDSRGWVGGHQPSKWTPNYARPSSRFPIWSTSKAPASTPILTLSSQVPVKPGRRAPASTPILTLSSQVPVQPGRGICIFFLPNRRPAPAHSAPENTSTYEILNRNYDLLELNVTQTKQTTRPRSNRDRNVVLNHDPGNRKARRGCMLNHDPDTRKSRRASGTAKFRTSSIGFSLCRQTFPYVRAFTPSHPTATSTKPSPFLIGTPKRLEIAVTQTKQTIEVRSNRDKMMPREHHPEIRKDRRACGFLLAPPVPTSTQQSSLARRYNNRAK